MRVGTVPESSLVLDSAKSSALARVVSTASTHEVVKAVGSATHLGQHVVSRERVVRTATVTTVDAGTVSLDDEGGKLLPFRAVPSACCALT